MIRRSFFALLMAIFAAGCRSDLYYQNQAVERAREFVMKNPGDLTSEELNFIRFNTPVLLHSPVLSGAGSREKEHLSSDLRQVCVTWIIPGRDDLCMVFGVSGPRMDDWYPNRILNRNYSKHVPVLAAPAALARNYAQNNFFTDMTAADCNLVRFTFPYLMRTDFELNFDPEGKLSAGDIAKLRSAAAGKIQYSLVWHLSGGHSLAVTGLADPGMRNWQIAMGQVTDTAQLSEYIEAVVMTPEQGLELLPAGENVVEEK